MSMKRLKRYGGNGRVLHVLTEAELLAESSPEIRKELVQRIKAARPIQVENAVERYEDTNNPLYLWAAIGYALDGNVPLPKQARNYLIDCANALIKPETNKPEMIAGALRLSGRAAQAYANRSLELDAATAYASHLPGFETQENAAETLGIEPRHFQRIWKKHRSLFKIKK